MGLNFKSLASDWLLPAAGAYLGYGYGGATGAGIGAGIGRFGGGLIKDEETGSNIKNSALAGAAGYGAGSLFDNYYGYGGNFGSMGDLASSGGASGGVKAAGGGGGAGMLGGMTQPVAMMGLSALANAYGASEAQKNAEDIYSKQLANWNQTAFPNAARVDAQTSSAMSGINQQSMLARQKLMDSMAARGMGQSSGVMAGAMAEEDRARRQRMSALANQLIQFKNTPMYAPPQYQGTANTPTGTLASSVGTAAGIGGGLALQQMFGGNQDYQQQYYKKLLDRMG